MADYTWGIRLKDNHEEPTAHVVDFDVDTTALCGVTAELRLDADRSLPVCEECANEALDRGILSERDGDSVKQDQRLLR